MKAKQYATVFPLALVSLICLSPQFSDLYAQIPTQGLIAFYPFNDQAKDESGNGLHGTVYGATRSSDRHNKFNSAYFFDGINDYINLGTNSVFNFNSSYTLAAWISPTNTAKIQRLLVKDNGVSGRGFSIGDAGSQTLAFYDRGLAPSTVNTSAILQINTWQHVVAVYDAGAKTMAIYVNGMRQALSTSVSGSPSSAANPLTLGGNPSSSGGEYYNGMMDEIRIYNYALSDYEIAMLSSPCTQYAITTSSTPSIGGTTSGGGMYGAGATVTIAAYANACYHFSWSENGLPFANSPSYTFTVTNNHNFVANFAINQYTISTSSYPSNGGFTSGGGRYDCGQNIIVQATANPGYTFIQWTENSSLVSTSNHFGLTVSRDYYLIANFAENRPQIISSSPLPAGIVNKNYFRYQLSASGGTPPYTNWRIINGSIPGLSLSTDGFLEGIPTLQGKYRITVQVTDQAAMTNAKEFDIEINFETLVKIENKSTITDFNLFQNYPNPFNSKTIIRYAVPALAKVKIDMYTNHGEFIKQIVNEVHPVGHYEVCLDCTGMASGIYLVIMKSDQNVAVRKISYLK